MEPVLPPVLLLTNFKKGAYQMKKHCVLILSTLICLFVSQATLAKHLFVMQSSSAITNAKPLSFAFRVNNGQWSKVAAGARNVYLYYQPVTNLQVKFGSGATNAVLVNCHRVIKQGAPDTIRSYPGSQRSYKGYSTSGTITSALPLPSASAEVVHFTLTGLGSQYCSNSNADCQVYDCSFSEN